jgi:hypothetical protein
MHPFQCSGRGRGKGGVGVISGYGAGHREKQNKFNLKRFISYYFIKFFNILLTEINIHFLREKGLEYHN